MHDKPMDIYSASKVPRYANRPNCWAWSWVDRPVAIHGEICTVQLIALGVWKVCLQTSSFQPNSPPVSQVEVFWTWGCTWLWDNLQCSGDADWLWLAIKNGTCIMVADGLYIPDVHTLERRGSSWRPGYPSNHQQWSCDCKRSYFKTIKGYLARQ